EAGELNEVRIAADVFNRADTFDPTRDSIARVEVHRLRRRLKQYYLAEGSDHPIQIEIRPGSYTPVFRYTDQPPVKLENTPAPIVNGTYLDGPIRLEKVLEPEPSQEEAAKTLEQSATPADKSAMPLESTAELAASSKPPLRRW